MNYPRSEHLSYSIYRRMPDVSEPSRTEFARTVQSVVSDYFVQTDVAYRDFDIRVGLRDFLGRAKRALRHGESWAQETAVYVPGLRSTLR